MVLFLPKSAFLNTSFQLIDTGITIKPPANVVR
jgi:hypothetical protein